MKRLAAVALLVVGCGHPDPMRQTADAISGVNPEWEPIVAALQAEHVADNPKELISLTFYSRITCAQKGSWTAGEIRADLRREYGKTLSDEQGRMMAAAYDQACVSPTQK